MKNYSITMGIVDFIPVISFLCSLAMGYLSSKDFTQSYMNWIAQMINIVGQGLLFYGVIVMNKAGIADLVLGK
ncbi:hypothetical protein SAMN04487928_10866 [Butyrivibrio proteoclasticus]|uniref:Uncharacterized protein n=1 Tax=Butyrivibrio proteoclasticus TaxID=43305 RepID=A0A1I5T8G8_9FIRM|nr:hypothetical protein [Butyrivibrio proteoclasticus]SFP79339.1 hypothetical protein SAMN04487928_10866 [Butyrivibrio proteoclasticus]